MIFGVIGLGRFGKLWATLLAQLGQVKGYDIINIAEFEGKNIEMVSLKKAVEADIVFLCVPISEFKTVCEEIKIFLPPKTIVVDCCSVKIYPVNIMKSIFLKTQSLLATHPLFGPDSFKASNPLKQPTLVICPIRVTEDQQSLFKSLFRKIGLHIKVTTPEEHDKRMAESQSLVHFIGRGLNTLHLKSGEVATSTFQSLLNINQTANNDSWELFYDMHRHNPYTKEIREKLIHSLQELNDILNLE